MSKESALADIEFLRFLVANGYRDIRFLPGRRWASTFQFMFTAAIIVGRIGDRGGYGDRWCYHAHADAKAALLAWDGTGEPNGWHRHPATGRRIAETDDEIDALGERPARGSVYVRG